MRTVEEKLNKISKCCDKIVDEFVYSDDKYPSILYEEGRCELAKMILNLIEEE